MREATRPHTQVAAIGRLVDIAGFGLAGVLVEGAETAEEARAAWARLPAAVGLVILGADAADALPAADTAGRLTVVVPR